MASSVISNASGLRERYRLVRQRSLELCEPLTPEDMMVQSCPEASPAKWHIAHTAWFFESFVLNEFLSGYRIFNADFPWLFNSYYQTFAEFPDKRLRASFSRPALSEILRYREHVDAGIDRLLEHDAPEEALRRIELGLNHEEQHQELLLTDIKHALYTNPCRPVPRFGSWSMRAAWSKSGRPRGIALALITSGPGIGFGLSRSSWLRAW
jgi:hypothetical protein